MVGIGSNGQDFLVDDKIVARTSLSDKRLNSGKETSVIKLLMNWTKTIGQTINQMIFQGRDVSIKDLRVPTVQLKLLNFWEIYAKNSIS